MEHDPEDVWSSALATMREALAKASGGAEDVAETWRRQRRFTPRMAARERERKIKGWREALARTLLKP